MKRAGRKVVMPWALSLSPASHRLDGGSMQRLLRYDARSGSKMSSIFRLVHRVDAPLPGSAIFFAQNMLPGMLLDERHIWGKANPAIFPTGLVGYLLNIYRIDSRLEAKAQCVAETELLRAYKTQHAVLNDRKLRAFS